MTGTKIKITLWKGHELHALQDSCKQAHALCKACVFSKLSCVHVCFMCGNPDSFNLVYLLWLKFKSTCSQASFILNPCACFLKTYNTIIYYTIL